MDRSAEFAETSGKYFTEEVEHRPPRTLGGEPMVADARDNGLVGVSSRVGEAVLGAAVEVQAPVDSGSTHLFLKRQALLDGDVRVLRPHADEYLAGDVARVLRAGGSKAWVEADHGLKVRTCSGELKHHGCRRNSSRSRLPSRGRPSARRGALRARRSRSRACGPGRRQAPRGAQASRPGRR